VNLNTKRWLQRFRHLVLSGGALLLLFCLHGPWWVGVGNGMGPYGRENISTHGFGLLGWLQRRRTSWLVSIDSKLVLQVDVDWALRPWQTVVTWFLTGLVLGGWWFVCRRIHRQQAIFPFVGWLLTGRWPGQTRL